MWPPGKRSAACIAGVGTVSTLIENRDRTRPGRAGCVPSAANSGSSAGSAGSSGDSLRRARFTTAPPQRPCRGWSRVRSTGCVDRRGGAARRPRVSGDRSNRRGGVAPRENTAAPSGSHGSAAVTGSCRTFDTSRAP